MRLLKIAIDRDSDILLVRKRARRIAELLGFDHHDQTRITTAVSELTRNALENAGGGAIEFAVAGSPQEALQIVVSDKGPGIADLDTVMSAGRKPEAGIGLGLRGAARLMDSFAIDSRPGVGTIVKIGKMLPTRARKPERGLLSRIGQTLAAEEPSDPLDELQRQNREMMVQLQDLQQQQEALKNLNRELQDTNRGVVALYAELDERADYLRRADELKSKFLSNMSHEFRTPLNSILALSRLLLSRADGELTAEQQKQIGFIRKAAESLTSLVDDLLDLAKVEAGKMVVRPVEFTVEKLFGMLRGMLRPLVVGDAVALVFEEAADLPALQTDEGKVSQILRNLLSNAIKFTEQGEVRVWAAADPAADSITFNVRDTGIGIAEHDLGLIFEEFGQVPNSSRSRFKGTGLGLPLSKKIAEILGGSISVESAPGQGSLFSVSLPRVYPGADAVEFGEGVAALEPDLVPVLVVDDDPADAFIVERALAGTRYQPIFVRTVAAATRAIRHFEPAALLLDILLFGDEAWRLLLGLRQTEATEHIPIVVTSASGEERKALHLGADAYLRKPVDAEILLHELDRLTGLRSTTRVLVVDDEEVTRYLVRQLLPRGTYDVREAATGTEGLARLSSDPPDVIVLDLKMPGMSGFELLERIKDDANRKHLPVIILTSAILSASEQERLGRAARIISKSTLTSDLLTGAIADVLGRVSDAAAAD